MQSQVSGYYPYNQPGDYDMEEEFTVKDTNLEALKAKK